MGRVSKAQAALNRQHIVETACRLFRQHGVEGVSIADIMAAAGLTPGGFYKHFASKEVLVDEAFALAFQQAMGAWDQVAQRERPDGDSALAALVRATVGAEQARSAVMVGDSYPHDVLGARAVGMRPVLIARGDRPTPEDPEMTVIRSLTELPDLL